MTSLIRPLLACLLIVTAAGCASETGSRWTFAPVAAGEGGEAGASPSVGPTSLPGVEPASPPLDATAVPAAGGMTPPPGADAAASPAQPTDESPGASPGAAGGASPDASPGGEEVAPSPGASPGAEGLGTSRRTLPGLIPGASPVGSPAASPAGSPAASPAGSPAGEARVIDLEATGALQFAREGQPVTDIPVTPGETVLFRIDNTAGFDHNFYIGTDDELSVPNATTEVGIPTWQSGVQELEWQVPDDLGGLKYGCTVPGHYAIMRGTFSEAS